MGDGSEGRRCRARCCMGLKSQRPVMLALNCSEARERTESRESPERPRCLKRVACSKQSPPAQLSRRELQRRGFSPPAFRDDVVS